MNLLEITKAAKFLTTKDVMFIDSDNNHQNKTTIFVYRMDRVYGIFHEIIHFIAAKSEDRFNDNLSYEGLDNFGYDSDMFDEERLVGHISLMIIEQYQKKDTLYDYSVYLATLGNNFNYDSDRLLAIERLESYKKEFNIDPIKYFYDVCKIVEC